MNLIIYIFYYFLILISIVGYGYSFQNLFLNEKKYNLGYLGIYGIFSLIFISYLSYFFVTHNIFFNLILLIIGLYQFFRFFINSNYIEKIDIKFLIGLFLFLFIATLAAKSHDDFPYYHFAYIHLLTSIDSSLGIGLFNHGFRTPSSIFYLSSLFYLPKIEYQLIHITPIYFLGFVNFILLKKIFKLIRIKKKSYIIILSILSLALINIFFYRIGEHGTDRSAQIILLLVFIQILEIINDKNLNDINIINRILILCTIAISLKVFYFIYFSLFFLIIFHQKTKINFLINLFKNKISYVCLLLISFLLITNVMNSGCLIYPMSITCFENLSWSIPIQEVNNMNQWYQQWSKGGATPNFRVENPKTYIQNLNWFSNWLDVYFFNKVSDYLFGLIFLILISVLFLINKNKKKVSKKQYISIYILLILLFLEWFFYHPALRYGGYHLIALLFFIPFSIFFEKNINFEKRSVLKLKFFILIIFAIFFMRNIDRIHNEYQVYKYDLLSYPSYNLEFQNFGVSKRISEIKKCKNLKNECTLGAIKIQKNPIIDIFSKK